MNNCTETELKLRFMDDTIGERITGDPLLRAMARESWGEERLISVYYDTPSLALEKKKIAFRIRKEARTGGNTWIATVKAGGTSKGGLHERKEWNVPVLQPVPDPGVFSATGSWPLLANALGNEELRELFITNFRRQKIDLYLPGGGVVEVAVDLGEIQAGEKRRPIREIELEQKGGKKSELLRLGVLLAKRYPLFPEPISKYHQGLKLAGLDKREQAGGDTPRLDGEERDVIALAGRVIGKVQEVIGAQQQFLENDQDLASLQQLKTKIDRLCFLLSASGLLLGKDGWAKYYESLRQVKGELAGLTETAAAKTIAEGRYTPLTLGIWAWLLEAQERQ